MILSSNCPSGIIHKVSLKKTSCLMFHRVPDHVIIYQPVWFALTGFQMGFIEKMTSWQIFLYHPLSIYRSLFIWHQTSLNTGNLELPDLQPCPLLPRLRSRTVYLQMWYYIPGTQLTSIFEGQPSKTRPFPIKTRVCWVLGIYIWPDIDISYMGHLGLRRSYMEHLFFISSPHALLILQSGCLGSNNLHGRNST